MRMIHRLRCECCNVREAVWVVGDRVLVCDDCRLSTITWMRAAGFSLARAHPFTDMLCDVSGPPEKLRLKREL